MHYLVIERFRNGDPVPIYRRFREKGRMMPDGLHYVSSWITEDLASCYQIMETTDPRLFDEWMANWSDLTDFELVPVLSSAQVQERLAL